MVLTMVILVMLPSLYCLQEGRVLYRLHTRGTQTLCGALSSSSSTRPPSSLKCHLRCWVLCTLDSRRVQYLYSRTCSSSTSSTNLSSTSHTLNRP
jgi:hypothetical protein